MDKKSINYFDIVDVHKNREVSQVIAFAGRVRPIRVDCLAAVLRPVLVVDVPEDTARVRHVIGDQVLESELNWLNQKAVSLAVEQNAHHFRVDHSGDVKSCEGTVRTHHHRVVITVGEVGSHQVRQLLVHEKHHSYNSILGRIFRQSLWRQINIVRVIGHCIRNVFGHFGDHWQM